MNSRQILSQASKFVKISLLKTCEQIEYGLVLGMYIRRAYFTSHESNVDEDVPPGAVGSLFPAYTISPFICIQGGKSLSQRLQNKFPHHILRRKTASNNLKCREEQPG